MKSLKILLLFVFLLSSCAPFSAPIPTSLPTQTFTALSTSTLTPTGISTPTRAPSRTPKPFLDCPKEGSIIIENVTVVFHGFVTSGQCNTYLSTITFSASKWETKTAEVHVFEKCENAAELAAKLNNARLADVLPNWFSGYGAAIPHTGKGGGGTAIYCIGEWIDEFTSIWNIIDNITHEHIHLHQYFLFSRRFPDAGLPVWLYEGQAEREGELLSYALGAPNNAFDVTENLLGCGFKLSELAIKIASNNDCVYMQGNRAFLFMDTMENGKFCGKSMELWEHLEQGASLNEAFLVVYEMSFAEFEARFDEHREKRYLLSELDPTKRDCNS